MTALRDEWEDETSGTWSHTTTNKTPVTVTVEPASSNAYGPPIHLQLQQGENTIGLWLDLDTWEAMHQAGHEAHDLRVRATERRWT